MTIPDDSGNEESFDYFAFLLYGPMKEYQPAMLQKKLREPVFELTDDFYFEMLYDEVAAQKLLNSQGDTKESEQLLHQKPNRKTLFRRSNKVEPLSCSKAPKKGILKRLFCCIFFEKIIDTKILLKISVLHKYI